MNELCCNRLLELIQSRSPRNPLCCHRWEILSRRLGLLNPLVFEIFGSPQFRPDEVEMEGKVVAYLFRIVILHNRTVNPEKKASYLTDRGQRLGKIEPSQTQIRL